MSISIGEVIAHEILRADEIVQKIIECRQAVLLSNSREQREQAWSLEQLLMARLNGMMRILARRARVMMRDIETAKTLKYNNKNQKN